MNSRLRSIYMLLSGVGICFLLLLGLKSPPVAQAHTEAFKLSGRNNQIKSELQNEIVSFKPIFLDGQLEGYKPLVADINGDGSLDVVIRGLSSSTIYYNLGDSGFLNAQLDFEALLLGDFNGDGAVDMVGLDPANPAFYKMFYNDGSGTFTPGNTLDLPNLSTTVAAIGDMNGDGALDIVTSHGSEGDISGHTLVLINNGQGVFDPSESIEVSITCIISPLALGDLNNDGKLDIAGHCNSGDTVFRNNGSAQFLPFLIFPSVKPDDLLLGDINEDGWLDIVHGSNTANVTIYINSKDGHFAGGVGQNYLDGPYGGMSLGEFNNDGALDILLGGMGTPAVLLLSNPMGGFDHQHLDNSYLTKSVAVADMNGDGALDIIFSNYHAQSVVSLRTSPGSFLQSLFFGDLHNTYPGDIIAADFNGDGLLDILQGVKSNGVNLVQDMIYLNSNWPFSTGDPLTADNTETDHLAVGDVNGDGFVDIIRGGEKGITVFYNNGSADFSQQASFINPKIYTLALGDLNGDQALDLVVGEVYTTVIFINNGSGIFGESFQLATGFTPGDLALGDMNSDGSLDIIIGAGLNTGPGMIFYNNGKASFSNGVPFGKPQNTSAIAIADMNSDGALDIVQGNESEQSKIYLNNQGDFNQVLPFGSANDTISLDIGDLNGDGALDIVQGNLTQPSMIFYNDRTGNFSVEVPFSTEGIHTTAVAVADINNDGALDIVLGKEDQIQEIYINRLSRGRRLPNDPPSIALQRPGQTQIANFYSSSEILSQHVLPVSYTLYDNQSDQATIRAFYSLDGGGLWRPAVAVSGTVTMTLNTSPQGTAHTYLWDTFASGFFGQSDNVTFRIQVYTAGSGSGIASPQTFHYTNTLPGPYLYPYLSAATLPFRMRGTQVRVINQGEPSEGALVYRLPAGETLGGSPLADRSGDPFRTDALGYLHGRGELALGDQLVALAPITYTHAYTLYYTNGAPTPDGVNGYIVSAAGVQTVTVSSAHPLALFNLNLSLEWDARNDSTYLDQLSFNLKQASQYLYDFTNGQAALGNIDVFQNRDLWGFSNIVIKANNRLRPFAVQGGIVMTDTLDPQHNTAEDTIQYSPGQVMMGATWNRYGRPGQSMGDDWAIALAHELGHYLLYEDDVYSGLNAERQLVSINTCLGSAMGDPYSSADNSEFIFDQDYWDKNCSQTLANQTLQRDEWQTLHLWYPEINIPTSVNPGPSSLTYDFAHILINAPYSSTLPLADPTFFLDYQDGWLGTAEARAYIVRDEYVVDLGGPYTGQNKLLARGAQPGDKVCIFDRPIGQFGCETVTAGDDRIALRYDSSWNPVVKLTPVTSTTLTVEVTVSPLKANQSLWARIFPDSGFGQPPVQLTFIQAAGIYRGSLQVPYFDPFGSVQLWVDETVNPRREAIFTYSLGGNPGHSKVNPINLRWGDASLRWGGIKPRLGEASLRWGGTNLRWSGAPVLSPNGQMSFYTENPLAFITGTLFTIQEMNGLPALPAGRTLIGQGYNLVTSSGLSLPAGTITVRYLSNDVLAAGAQESDLQLYFYNGSQWKSLNSILDTNIHMISAPSQGQGLYALVASLRVSLYGPGWNLVAYPLQYDQPVASALASIDRYYTTVYGFEPSDNLDPWRMYDKSAPVYANDLDYLRFGRGYWIRATQSITLYLEGGIEPVVPILSETFLPPATYYGTISAEEDAGFIPVAGLPVTAWIEDTACGQGVTQEYKGQVVYSLHVWAHGPGREACGTSGSKVIFYVGFRRMGPVVTWDNDQAIAVNLTPYHLYLYLPFVHR